MTTAKNFLLGLFCVLICAGPELAFGGETAEPKETLLKPMTVTAQKREENVQEVPVAVSVMNDIDIKDAVIEATHDIQNFVPNMKTGAAGSRGYYNLISIRGISNTGIGDPGVALYIDDIPYTDTYIFNTPIFDVDRIEVLKGPQGTLYGKNTEAGAINIVTKQPGNKIGGWASVELGTYDYIKGAASLDVPVIADTLAFRITGFADRRNGYIKNVTNDSDVDGQQTKAGRIGAYYTPTDDLSINLNLSYTDMDDGGFPLVPMNKDKYAEGTGIGSLGDFEIAKNYEGESKSQDILSSLKVKYEMDALDIIAVTGLRSNDNKLTLDGDATPAPMFIGFNSNDATAFTQEVRFISKPEITDFKWIIGAFYGNEDKDISTGYILEKDAAEFYNVPVGTTDKMAARQTAIDAALFGQSTLRFLDEKLGLTFGLRYDIARRTIDREHLYGETPSVPGYDDSTTFTKFLPKFAIDYRLTNHIMAYGNYAKGYKAGGYSFAVDNLEDAKYDPEISDAFEVGLKSEFPDMGLRFNIAGFYTLVDDYQDRVQIDQTTVLQSNVSTMTAYGVEVESEYRFAEEWTLLGTFGYTDARYGDYVDPSGVNVKDNHVSLIPEYDLGLALQYRSEHGFMGRMELHQVGESYLNRTNTDKLSSYTLANIKIGYETENWDAYIALDNISDEEYYTDAYEDPALGYMGMVGAPRTIRLMASMHF